MYPLLHPDIEEGSHEMNETDKITSEIPKKIDFNPCELPVRFLHEKQKKWKRWILKEFLTFIL